MRPAAMFTWRCVRQADVLRRNVTHGRCARLAATGVVLVSLLVGGCNQPTSAPSAAAPAAPAASPSAGTPAAVPVAVTLAPPASPSPPVAEAVAEPATVSTRPVSAPRDPVPANEAIRPVSRPPAKQVRTVTEYLDDLRELPGKVTAADWYGTHGATNYSPGGIQRVRVKGVPQTHAISQHASSQGTVHVEFDVGARYDAFQGLAGFMAPTPDDGLENARQAPNWNGRSAASPVTFHIKGDGQTLWSSRPIQKFDDWQEFDVSVKGVKILRLEISCAGPANFCWSAWAAPKLTKLVETPSTPSEAPLASESPDGPAPSAAAPAAESQRAAPAGPVVEDLATLTFAEPTERICWGGGGRYLVVHLAKSAQLQLIDVEQLREITRIDLGGQAAQFAANQTHLVVAIGGKNLQSYELETGKRKQLAAYKGQVSLARMGYASHGPLLLWFDEQIRLYDPVSLKPLVVSGDVLTGSAQYGFDVRVSADGQTFTGWTTGISGQAFGVMRWDGKQVTLERTPEQYSDNERWAQPTFDGSLLIVARERLLDSTFQPVTTTLPKDSVWVPTPDPRFLLSIAAAEEGKSSVVSLHTASDLTAFCRLESFEPVNASSLANRWGYFGSEPRVMLVPALERLAVVPVSNDRVVIRRVDVPAALRDSGRMLVYSNPPARIPLGQAFEYQLEAVTPNSGPLKYQLVSAPDGMQISEAGKITWLPRVRPIGGATDVIVSVHDAADQETLHQFRLHVAAASTVRAAAPEPDAASPSSEEAPEDSPASDSAPSSSPPSSSTPPESILELTQDSGFPVLNARRDGTWLVQGQELWALGADGVRRGAVRQLPHAYKQVVERADYFVAINGQEKAVDILNKRNLKVERSVKLACLDIMDIVLHPSKPLSYVAMKVDVDVPRYQFAVVQERTGQAFEDGDYIGTWLAITPDGRHLVTGYRDIYENGAQLILNPDRWHITPTYGNLDWLIRYDLDRDGRPHVRQAHTDAGGNGQGLRMSPDGKQVTYLSHVGYPRMSGHLGGFATGDFDKVPVKFETNKVGTTYDLAYHPVLPLVASPGSGSAVFFHRDTGAVEQNRLASIPDLLAQGKTNRIYFSPDGKHLVFDIKIEAVRYFVKSELKLNGNERRRTPLTRTKGEPKDTASDEPRGRKRAPLRDFEALAGGLGKDVSAADISRLFSPSVVIVATDDGSSGTGFVVGSKGYILTCAHCVSETGTNWVYYHGSGSSRSEPNKREAQVINLDEARDIALLKIAAVGMSPVRMGIGHAVASGERVNVIGNPGVGDLILDQTITEGIVSNPSRKLDDQNLIQTSAAINPGSSGSPLFNARGLVIGMVAKKANIEGAGFAVPVEDLGRFLIRSCQWIGEDARLQREWYDDSGKHRIVAALVGIEGDRVKLIDSNRERDVEIVRLSTADQEFLSLLRKSRPQP